MTGEVASVARFGSGWEVKIGDSPAVVGDFDQALRVAVGKDFMRTTSWSLHALPDSFFGARWSKPRLDWSATSGTCLQSAKRESTRLGALAIFLPRSLAFLRVVQWRLLWGCHG